MSRHLTRRARAAACAVLAIATRALPAAAQRATAPVLDFPQPGLDDSAKYDGYQTRFYRDARRNTVQVYLDGRSGRVVAVWADAANESAGLTIRSGGAPAPLRWAARDATTSESGRTRTIAIRLASTATRLTLGGIVLGSMRVERDYQYAERHLAPFAPAYREPVLERVVAAIAALPAAERARALAALGARDSAALAARLVPVVTPVRDGALAGVRFAQTSFDAKHHMALDVLVDPRAVALSTGGDTIALAARGGAPVALTLRVSTDETALTPLTRAEIFDARFLAFADSLGRSDPRIERQLRAVEVLSSREKLMAGMPTYATYFGRDQMMSALMMQQVWTPAMMEHVIGSVLRKLRQNGEVSHEEALGGQAIREGAAEYLDALVRSRAASGAAADSATRRARAILANMDSVRENYHMMDDELQLPVLVARYLRDPRLSDAAKQRFLRGSERGATRLALLVRELDVVARRAAPYAASRNVTDLVSFARRDDGRWESASWRDSGAGYANGRFAMDINAIWMPAALGATDEIVRSFRALSLMHGNAIEGATPGDALAPLLAPGALAHAEQAWKGAVEHFVVRLSGAEARARIDAKLASLGADERAYWQRTLDAAGPARDSLTFLAIALDEAGNPIGVENTDPATALYLFDLSAPGASTPDAAPFRALDMIVRPYPTGLLVGGLGPVVANDAFAPPAVWQAFERDRYHSPRVVWGREVNLLELGIARQIAAATTASGAARTPSLQAWVDSLGTALRGIRTAVDASGFAHSELWSYRIAGDRLEPMRYGSSGDVQLWSTTSLAVQWALAHLATRH